MKLTLSRASLRDALQGLGRIVSTKATLPILQCIRFDADGDHVAIAGTNLDQYGRYTAEGTVTRKGACVVDLERLKPFVKGSEKDTLTLDAGKDSVTLTNPVHGQNIDHTLPAYDPADWPSTPAEIETAAAPESFMARLQALMPFACQDPSRAVLNGIYMEKAENGCRMITTDGKRLTCYEVGELPIAESAILPLSKFIAWSRLADPVKLGAMTGKTGKWVRLECGPWSVTIRGVDGTYPNWRHVVPDDSAAKVSFTLSPEDAAMLRKALPTFPGHDQHQPSIRIAGKDGRLCAIGRGIEDKKSTALDLPGSTSTGDLQAAVNRQFLIDALTAGFRQFGVTENEGPLLARDGTGGLHILMPMRLPADEPVSTQAPQPAPPVAEPQPVTPKETVMPKTVPDKSEPGALDRLIAAFDAAKSKVREANEALTQVAGAIKEAIREDKQRRAEIDTVRAGLLKLQAIRV
jgi:DNA polymerase III sliding clamp (beta) subunit (PCNA family)